MHELFETQACERPDAVAVVFENQTLTYGELNARANQLAHHLRRLGVGPETLVGVCVERSLEMIVGLLGVLKAGGAYLPLDPDYPVDRLAYMLADAQPLLTLTQDHLRQRLPEDATTLSLDADWPSIAAESAHDPKTLARPQNLAYVIYTSGSTGKPKGVGVAHRGLVNRLDWMQKRYGLIDDDVVLQKTPFSFDVSVWEFFWPLQTGACLTLVAPGDHREPDRLAKVIESCAVTTMHFVPTMLLAFLSAVDMKALPSLRRVICSGEELPASAVMKFHDVASCELHNLYGPTEGSIDVTEYCCANDDIIERVPIGCPISNTQIYLLDWSLEPVPVGISGELYIGGAGLARGYLNRTDFTSERFIPNPFGGPGERLYRTGDLARYRQDGNIEYLGRADHQVKIRGFRIELGEIEAALARLETVREAVALAREDAPGEKRIVAYVVGEDGAELNATQLRASLARDLPDYMIPSAFVFLEALPLTSNGKVDRKALPAPDLDAQAAHAYVAPRTPTESALCRIWADVLGVERVGVNDNFFELGGHSLLAMTLIEKMRREGLPSDVRSLFAQPTPGGLAAVVGQSSAIVVPPNLIPAGCDALTPAMLPLAELTQAEIDRIVAAVPGGATNVQDIYPLAPLQEGILFHHLMAEKGDPYLLPSLLAFDSRERIDTFCEAVNLVIARHDILRTAVMWEGLREPMQVVWREAPLVVEEVQLDPGSGDIAQQLLDRFSPRQFRLDVRRAPMMRVFWAHDSIKDRWLLLLLGHHLAFDHSTLEILLEEAKAQLSGRSGSLPTPTPFRNFVAQARLGVSQVEHEAFFTEMLGDVTEPTAPFGMLDVRGDGSGVEEARLDVDLALARRARTVARALGVSVASLWHQAFAQVLARISGRNDVVFGTVLFGRMHGGEGADRAIGLFINTLPIRVRVGQESVRESARLLQDRLTTLLRHEHAPLTLALRCSGIEAPAPLFSALLNYRHSAPETESSAAFEGVTELYSQVRTNYPLTLSVDDFGEAFRVTAQTQHPLDPSFVCGYMQTALEGLVTALETAPETPALTIDVLSEAERHRLLVDWNDTAADYPKGRCIHELFEAQVSKSPEAIAVIYEDQRLTYGELNARANRLARHLRESGVGPDARVAICVERSLEMIVGLLAILKAGGAYVPLDPDYPADRLAYMLEDSAPVALLTRPEAKEAVALFRDRLAEKAIPIVDLLEDALLWAEQHDSDPQPWEVGLTPRNLAYLIYTSGSTGKPKGVMVEHVAVTNYLWWLTQAHAHEDGSVVSTSLSFDATVTSLYAPLLSGGPVRLLPKRYEIEGLDRLMQTEIGCGLLKITPSHLHMLGHSFVKHGRCSVGVIISGGETLQPETVALWRRIKSDIPIVNHYGPTETVVGCATYSIPRDISFLKSIPIGRPISNTQIYLVNRFFEPVPVGVCGELYIGGAGVARGYLERPDLTAERFIPNPFGRPGERLYRTGDLARYRADGNIEFLGRADHQVKIRGFRIELGEIEVALGRLDTVREVVALAREDAPGDKRLVAYIVGEGGAELTATQLRASLARDLPDYMIPSAFVFLKALPLTPNGKVDRNALPAPNGAESATTCVVGPRTATEWLLLKEFKSVLGLESIGIDDNFFEFGGHSLTAIKLIDGIRRKVSGELPIMAIFQAPTARKLGELISSGPQDDYRSLIVPLRRGGGYPAIYCIHPAGGSTVRYQALADSLEGLAPVYGIQSRRIFDDRHMDESVEEMAIYYAGLIRVHQPHGPYHLLGWSTGGVTAAAIAGTLEALGERVAFLGIVDSILDRERVEDAGISDNLTVVLESFREFALLEGKNPSELLTEEDRKYLLDVSGGLSSEEQVRYAAVWGQERGYWQGISNELIDFLCSDAVNTRKLIDEHDMRIIEVPIHYWAARESLDAGSLPKSDWSQVSRGGLRLQIIDCDHASIVSEPIMHSQIRAALSAVWSESADSKELVPQI
ncbi:MAG: amino acid adenylation domain-containing protein [Methylocystis sp.]|uniref:amino acid adenylation domain-containing protein n=1 Tax=Methylocystis sp. TaxID=1911079 RepID=UPI003DA34939